MNEHQLAIIQVIATIPMGKVCSYGEVARKAGLPGKARYVGYTLKQLPNDSTLPWHRVINSSGRISFPTGSERYLEQKARLLAEGLELSESKTSLKAFMWID